MRKAWLDNVCSSAATRIEAVSVNSNLSAGSTTITNDEVLTSFLHEDDQVRINVHFTVVVCTCILVHVS